MRAKNNLVTRPKDETQTKYHPRDFLLLHIII